MKPNQELPPAPTPIDSPAARWELVKRISATTYFASFLGQKLDQYYAAEGTSDSYRLSIPKGGYLPSFELTTTSPEPGIPEVLNPPTTPHTPPKHLAPLATPSLFFSTSSSGEMKQWRVSRPSPRRL